MIILKLCAAAVLTAVDCLYVRALEAKHADNDVPYEMEDGVLSPAAAKQLIKEVVTQAADTDKLLNTVIALWLGPIYDPAIGVPRHVNEVADLGGITSASTAQHIERASLLSTATQTRMFGINQ